MIIGNTIWAAARAVEVAWTITDTSATSREEQDDCIDGHGGDMHHQRILAPQMSNGDGGQDGGDSLTSGLATLLLLLLLFFIILDVRADYSPAPTTLHNGI